MSILTQLYANNALSTLANSIGSADSTITLAVGTGVLYPSPGANQYFLITLAAGLAFEIVAITGRSGDTLTVMPNSAPYPAFGRGWEGTTAAAWSAGSAAEMRVTSGILASYLRKQDRMSDLISIDTLTTPLLSDSNSYICHSNDDANNPITAIASANPPISNTVWKFPSHPKVLVTGTVTGASNTLSITSSAIGSTLSFASGKYIIQFTSGTFSGLARMVTSTSTNVVSWATALSGTPSGGDTFNIYQSAWSILNAADSQGSNALLYAIIFGG